jgi:hypothetical protein
MSFEGFQNYARLYVIGALESEEIREFELARYQYGPLAEEFVNECDRLHNGLRLSLKPAERSKAIKAQLRSMVSRRNSTLTPVFSRAV